MQTQHGYDQFSLDPLPGPNDRPPLSSDSGVSRESSFSGSDRLSTDVSRNSSFSSRSSGSSPSVSRSCSWRLVDEVEPFAHDFNCARSRNITSDQRSMIRNPRFSVGSRNNEDEIKNHPRSSRALVKRPSINNHGRSNSESLTSGSKFRLSSPEGLIITTRYQIYSGTNSNRSEHTETQRRGVKSADNSPRSSVYLEDGTWMKNRLQILEKSIEKVGKRLKIEKKKFVLNTFGCNL